MTRRIVRRLVPLAALGVLGATLLVTADPAGARRQREITIQLGSPVLEQFPAITQSAPLTLAEIPDPDECALVEFCHTIPVRIPIPDVPKEDDYRVRFRIEFDDVADTHHLELYFWDNKQVKEAFGKKQPGDAGYDPRESDYTLYIADTDPRGEWIEFDRPTDVEYNFTILSFDGTNTGYAIRAEIVTESFVLPEEILPPPLQVTPPVQQRITPTQTPTTAPPAAPEVDESAAHRLEILELLGDESFDQVEGSFSSQLQAPEDLSMAPIAEETPPEEPSGLALLLGLGLIPVAVAGGGTYLFTRYRRAALAFS